MNDQNFSSLMNMSILSVNNLVVKEDNHEIVIDDSIILETDKGLVQIFNDYNSIKIININSVSKAKIWDSFNADDVEILVRKEISIMNNDDITEIFNYSYDSSYFFGTKCLSSNGHYVVGFCYGFDEMNYVNESDFESLLSKYDKTRVNIRHIKM